MGIMDTLTEWLRAWGLAVWVERYRRGPRPKPQSLASTNEYAKVGEYEATDAYILLKVDPQWSRNIAEKWSLEDSRVTFAAAVWGEWDVIMLVQTESYDDLLRFVDHLREHEAENLKSTETLLIRSDQRATDPIRRRLTESLKFTNSRNGAFLMLRAQTVTAALSILDNMTIEGGKILHYVGILGRYDVVVLVEYADDEILSDLVMSEFQGRHKYETFTMPAIAGMFCVDGRSINTGRRIRSN
jgi:uncharacterized protein with GYD domain/DNA-binding Lrp family transcriptional regulator